MLDHDFPIKELGKVTPNGIYGIFKNADFVNAKADCILITADCGGSNGYRNKLDKKITVLHFLPGTSKWNKIEHRLFSFISKNWRGKPLISLAVIVNLIGATKTDAGLTVDCVVDEHEYSKGQK